MSEPISSNASAETGANQPLAPHSTLTEFYDSPDTRPGFVRQLFDRAAPHYDGLSATLSFGSDKAYRKQALRRAGLKPGMQLLDVATGTGLVIRAALALGLPADAIVGLDPSPGMLAENRLHHSAKLLQGLGENLPFPDASFDFISMGYALRHVADLKVLFAEYQRVLKPGGRVLLLEISRPASRLAFGGMKLYLGKLLPFWIRCFTRHPDAAKLMEYYWATIAHCVPPETILQALKDSGFTAVKRTTMGGILNDYFGIKPSATVAS